ncbi:hypothetical protein QYC42_01215 [Ligilactobacillus salivarius]|uniref:hypothetical protein n=1 Tax=Ligilactobacillus salivarius TaxID=1624 RepID=UPI00263AF648|nr:hypothetical protein [Ligilactobacillus salivarius]MDN4847592.1 hypothetical protein [Ligilactobacillus salivarius]
MGYLILLVVSVIVVLILGTSGTFNHLSFPLRLGIFLYLLLLMLWGINSLISDSTGSSRIIALDAVGSVLMLITVLIILNDINKLFVDTPMGFLGKNFWRSVIFMSIFLVGSGIMYTINIDDMVKVFFIAVYGLVATVFLVIAIVMVFLLLIKMLFGTDTE